MLIYRFLLACAALVASVAPAGAAWREASGKHFVIYSEESESSLREFAERLERYDAAMRQMHDLPDRDIGPANRLTVYAVGNVDRVRRLAGAKDSFLAGFYVPRANDPVAFIPRKFDAGKYELDAETVLLHEYAHHFLFQNYSAAYPAWYAEGFAEFNATAKFEKDGSVSLGRPATHRAFWLFAGHQLPLEKMIAQLPSKMHSEQRESVYGRGWLLTHYLTFEPSRKGQLATYLNALNSGKAGVEAATAAFGDLRKLSRELDAYMKRRRITTVTVQPDAARVGKIAVRRLSPGEEALMDVRLVSRRGVNDRQAEALVAEARRAAAPHLDDPVAQAWLAEIEHDANNYAESEAAADRALAANPRSVDAMIYKGRVRLALAEAKKSQDSAVWKEARRWLLAANRIDPNDPEPLILFYRSFGAEGVRPTANAVAGLNQAFALAPQDPGLRMMVAYQYLVDNKAKEARAALAPLAFSPHAGGSGNYAVAVIEQIDAGNIEAALKAWQAPEEEEAGGGA